MGNNSEHSMSSNIRSSIIYSILTKNYSHVLSIISVILVSRFLSPSEIGIYAIASSIVLLASEFRLLGTAGYIIRVEELTQSQVRSTMGLSVLVSWALGVALIAASSTVSQFYGYDDLQIILFILSISFFLAPFISVSSSILIRNFQFNKILVIRATSATALFAITIILIFFNYSYFALAIGTSSGAVVEFFMSILLRPKGYNWTPRFRELKEIAQFGITSSLITFFQKLDETLTDVILGKLGSTHQVSIMSRSLGAYLYASNILVSGINSVMMPYFSDTRRNKADLYTTYYNTTLLVSGLTIPMFLVMSALAEPIILVLFGDQWLETIPLMKALVIWATLKFMHVFSNPFLLSNGFENKLLAKQVVKFIYSIVAISYSFRWGLPGVAYGLISIGLLDFLMTNWLIKDLLKCNYFRLAAMFIKPVVIGTICFGATHFTYSRLVPQGLHPILGILLVIFFICPIWLGLIFLLQHPLKRELLTILAKRK